MSSIQRPSRRLSARIQEKDDAILPPNEAHISGNVKATTGSLVNAPVQNTKANEKKRKMNYNEEDDGFAFKRVKKKPVAKPAETEHTITSARDDAPDTQPPPMEETDVPKNEDTEPKPKERRKRMSFSTPKPKEDLPPRRSKRLSKDNQQNEGSPAQKVPRKEAQISVQQRERPAPKPQKEFPKRTARESPKTTTDEGRHLKGKIQHQTESVPTLEDNHSATRIALPVADTPVIKRNKAMREGKSNRGERRSSLSSRGRRASSLIESGNSNALPHTEVDVTDYYKHIESDGLPEPRRMRQLLTWCAERALDEKPKGTEFEDSSARQAARVIEEELLKELSNKSELSDWFAREEVVAPKKPLPVRPNPRNVQNLEKMAELEEQIQRLRTEKEALESFLRPPSLPFDKISRPSHIDYSLLSETEAAALESIASPNNPTASDQISQRVNEVLESIGPSIDLFADGIHRLGQYRTTADNVAGRILAICAEKLDAREKEGRKKALAAAGQTEQQDTTPPKDLSSVLRSLSRADR